MARDPDGRWARQVRVRGIGDDGQRLLADASVLLIGVGALGSHVAETLVRAGIGTMWLYDRDVVDLGNLQRQVLFTEADAAAMVPKATAARTRLRQIDSNCRIDAFCDEFSAEGFEALPGVPHLIVDGTDNYPTRYLINDLAVRGGIPWIYGGAVGTGGSAMVVLPGTTPCLRCLAPDPPPTAEVANCETAGILAPTVAAVAAFQSAEALKLLTGNRDAVVRGVYNCDVWTGTHSVRLAQAEPSPDCPACGEGRFPALSEPAREVASLCGRDAVQVHPAAGSEVDLDRLADNLAPIVSELERTPHLLRFLVEDCTFSVFPGGRALLFGVRDVARAKVLYDRYVGAR